MRVGNLVLYLILGKSFQRFTMKYVLSYGLVTKWTFLCQLYSQFVEFYPKRILNFAKCFFCIYWNDRMFIFYSINVIYHVYWFTYDELSLYVRNNFYLIMMYNPFNVLLNLFSSFCWECFYLYWLGILICSFLFCRVLFFWLWNNSSVGLENDFGTFPSSSNVL